MRPICCKGLYFISFQYETSHNYLFFHPSAKLRQARHQSNTGPELRTRLCSNNLSKMIYYTKLKEKYTDLGYMLW